MAITRIKNSSIANNGPKYDSALAGLPYRPVIGTATDGGTGTTVSVAFTANNSGGAGITYTALSSPGSLTGTGSSSPVTVSGLTSGTAYTFQVKAGNSLGDSAYSAASNSVTPVTPTAFESIATITVGSGGSASIYFTSIPSTFTHLQLRGIVKNTAASTSVTSGFFRLNNDTGANYATHYLNGSGSAVGAGGLASQTLAYGLTDIGANATSVFGGFVMDILDYKNTSKYKTVRSLTGVDNNGSGFLQIFSGLWMSTSAVDSVTLIPGSNNFAQYSTVALYGIKEA